MDNDVQMWARERAIKRLNAECKGRGMRATWGDTGGDRNHVVVIAMARVIQQHEQSPLTVEERAMVVVEKLLSRCYDDCGGGYWQGSSYYQMLMLTLLAHEGITFAEVTDGN